MQQRTHVWLYVVFAAIIALRLLFVAYVPFGQTVHYHLEGLNDEPAHFNYVHYLAEHRAFPVETGIWKDAGAFVRNDFEYHQAPVYYMMDAPVDALAGSRAALYFGRLLSFVCGILGLLLILLILKKMGFSYEIQCAGVLVAGLLPVHVYFTSLVSNDSMSWLFSLLVLYLCIVPQNRLPDAAFFSWKRCMTIGALIGVGSLVKASLLMWFPLAAACACYSWYICKNKAVLIRMAVALCTALALNIPWFIRNLIHYKSITALAFTNGPAVSYPHLLTPKGFLIFLKTSVHFFWFPMLHVPDSRIHFMLGIVGAGILGIVCVLAVRYYKKRGKLSYNDLLVLGLLALNIVGYIKYNLIWGNREARFLYPALLPIIFMMVVPLNYALTSVGQSRWFFPLCGMMGLFGYTYFLLTF
jgi:hypothetical protein